MIALLRGSIAHREPNRAIIDVRGVGYEVYAPNRSIEAWATAADDAIVHVSTQVREDAITLYGFSSAVEREAFGVLMSVSGIGPKLALSCLEALPLESLSRAIEVDDLAMLSRIPGVGKKTAQRLALELKGKLPQSFAPIVGTVSTPAVPAAAETDTFGLALQRLGYSKPEIERVRLGVAREGLETAPLPDRLRVALRLLYGGER